mgnify:CR=1 FL=1
MVIVAVDDEKPARILLESTLRAVRPEAEIHMFSAPEDLLEYVNEFLADEKESRRLDELAEDFIFKYIEDEELKPTA